MQAGRQSRSEGLPSHSRREEMRQLRNCLVLCAALTAACAADFGEEPLEEEVGSAEQPLIAEWWRVCADPGTTIYYRHARIYGHFVGDSVNGGFCEYPEGCVVDFHVCDVNGCTHDLPVTWPGDDICFNNV
jgi:hypothetical protein